MDEGFSMGDRVKMSLCGIDMLKPKKPSRLGVIARRPNNTSKLSVRWDGLKTETLYPRTFIEKVPESE